MDSFFEEFGLTILEFIFLYTVFKILMYVLDVIWGFPL